jgi:hypothetical protein
LKGTQLKEPVVPGATVRVGGGNGKEGNNPPLTLIGFSSVGSRLNNDIQTGCTSRAHILPPAPYSSIT